MIKFDVRRNLIYPLQLLLWNFLRDTESSLINHFFEADSFLIFTHLMFLGEFLAGIIIFSYQKQFLIKNKTEEQKKLKKLQYIYSERTYAKKLDMKAIFVIITSAFSDFAQFSVSLQFPKIMLMSGSLEQRLRGNFTINNALFYSYVLRLPLFKHQKFSLIIIGIFYITIIITEFIFQEFNIFLTYGQFILALLYMLFIQFGNALIESIEKHLYEYYQLDPFFVLMSQGIVGFLFCLIHSFIYSPFEDIIKFRQSHSTSEFVILIFAFLLFLILSGGKNSFRVLTTKIYSPMTTTFMDYILNPFYLIFYYISGRDFISYGKKNLAYFLINLFISVIMSFCGGVYNEFLILFCCGLERDTHRQVTQRSKDEKELNFYLDDDNDSDG